MFLKPWFWIFQTHEEIEFEANMSSSGAWSPDSTKLIYGNSLTGPTMPYTVFTQADFPQRQYSLC